MSKRGLLNITEAILWLITLVFAYLFIGCLRSRPVEPRLALIYGIIFVVAMAGTALFIKKTWPKKE